jgi:hypothetical protein
MIARARSNQLAGGWRGSTSLVASTNPGRDRKNFASAAAAPVGHSNGGVSAVRARPQANTISRVDSSTLGMIAAANTAVNSGAANSSAHGSTGGTGLDFLTHEETRNVFPEVDPGFRGTWTDGT